jgi:hypothetical protein
MNPLFLALRILAVSALLCIPRALAQENTEHQMVPLLLTPGYSKGFFNIREPRIVMAEKKANDEFSIPIEGGRDSAALLPVSPLSANARVLAPGSYVAKVAHAVSLKSYDRTCGATDATIKEGTKGKLEKTFIAFDKNGRARLMAHLTGVEGHPEGLSLPYSDLNLELPPPTAFLQADPHWMSRWPGLAALHRWWEYTGVTGAATGGGVVDSAVNLGAQVRDDCRRPWNKALSVFSELRDVVSPEISTSPREDLGHAVAWTDFYDYVADMVGEPVNNCRPTSQSGKVLLAHEKKLIKKFREDLAKDDVHPPGGKISPESIAAVDACARTCYGEMGTASCYQKDGKFWPYALKAVVGTIANRAELIASKSDPLYVVADYNPQKDGPQFGGPRGGALSLDHVANGDLMANPITQVSALASQYNNWKCVPDKHGKTICGALVKSFCPRRKKNTDRDLFEKNRAGCFDGNPDSRVLPPPRYVGRTAGEEQAFHACAKYCAEAVFSREAPPGTKTDTFVGNLRSCRGGFPYSSFTSGKSPRLRECRPLDKKVEIRDDNGNCVNVNTVSCTRFWEQTSERSGCLN